VWIWPWRRRVRQPGRRVGALLACLLLAALACQRSYYEVYRARHPDWVAELPRPGAALEEVLAALYAPSQVEGIRVEVEHLVIHRADVQPWREISFERIRGGRFASDPAATYAVTAVRGCRATEGLREVRAQRVAYYLLPRNRLQSFDHYEFRPGCGQRNHFRAARGEAVALERELEARIAREHGQPRLALEQLYRRGLAYVEVGRAADARAMLLAAEPDYRAQRAQARQARGIEARRALAESERLRGNLMRALGVKPVLP
jgi:hypothetical protein